jgi:hypothetical protein
MGKYGGGGIRDARQVTFGLLCVEWLAPKRTHTVFKTWRKFEIKKVFVCSSIVMPYSCYSDVLFIFFCPFKILR